jgi:hypothetical protein
MNKKLQKLLAFLKSENVKFAPDKVSNFDDRDESRLIFSELMPERYCSYDAEIIDDVDGYHSVIQSHMQATLGEWTAKDIVISGTVDSEIVINFLHDGKTVKWKFDQNGTDYVSENFYKKLNSWVSRNLGGKFVSLPTYGQDVAFVYLPNKSAAKVDTFTGGTITANKFVDHFRCDEDIPGSFWDLRFDKRFNIDCQDDSGETALTAAIKAKNTRKALEALDEPIEVNPAMKNRSGMSPLQLARELELKEVVEYLERDVTRKGDKWSNTEKLIGSDMPHPMVELVSTLKDRNDLDSMHHFVSCYPWIDFARSETFELGHETLNVGPYYVVGDNKDYGTYSVKYYSESGNDYVKENIGLKEALELIDRFYK